MRANSAPGGTIREGALFFQTVAAGRGGHYSRGGTIRASTVVAFFLLFCLLRSALVENRLVIVESGSLSPCIDLS